MTVIKWLRYFKLMTHVAYILKLKDHWINVKRNHPEKINFKELTVAEHQILAEAQSECYHEELNSLRNKKLRKCNTLSSLRPMLTGDLFRVGGRAAQSFLPIGSKH